MIEPQPRPPVADSKLLGSIREKHPDASEREAWLLERLIGAMGVIRAETSRRGSVYSWGWNYKKDAFQMFNEWLMEQYGWELEWRKPEKRKKP